MPVRLTGLVVATFAPLDRDGNLNLAAIEKQAVAFADANVTAVFVNGTTGEAASLTMDERLDLTRRWCEVAARKLPVIVHVGGTCLADCMTLAEHAQRTGANGIAAVGPGYYKPRAMTDLVDFCGLVAGAAPELPFYYYHIPMRTGVEIRVHDFLRVAAPQIPNLAGAKFSDQDLMDFLRCVRFMDGAFDMLYGLDEMMLPALAAGARGAVGTTFNFAPILYERLIAAYKRGDMEAARLEQHRATELIACLNRHGFLPAAKAVMQIIGLDCGPPRLPLRALAKEDIEKLRSDLEGLGFFDWRW
jgi:N-acetylneuraminate lyase